jgi:hypothetical protein
MTDHGLGLHETQVIAHAEFEERQREERQAAERASVEAREKALAAEQEAKDKQRRDRDAEELTETLRRNFHAGNPAASAADFDRLLPKLKDDFMLAQAKRDPVQAEVAAQQASMPPGFSGTF